MDLDGRSNSRYQPALLRSSRSESGFDFGRALWQCSRRPTSSCPGTVLVWRRLQSWSHSPCDSAYSPESGWLYLARSSPRARIRTESSTRPGSDRSSGMTATVIEDLEFTNRADEKSYVMGTLTRGQRVRLRKIMPGGWAAIEPPPLAMGWIARSELAFDHDQETAEKGSRPGDPAHLPTTAHVVGERVMVRSGHLNARLPGPPWIPLQRGSLVRLIDRPGTQAGRGDPTQGWVAIVPPEGALCYIRSDGIDEVTPRVPAQDEQLASFQMTEDDHVDAEKKAINTLPPDAASEIRRIDAMRDAVLASLPIDQWRFDTVRAGYQTLLKRREIRRPSSRPSETDCRGSPGWSRPRRPR